MQSMLEWQIWFLPGVSATVAVSLGTGQTNTTGKQRHVDQKWWQSCTDDQWQRNWILHQNANIVIASYMWLMQPMLSLSSIHVIIQLSAMGSRFSAGELRLSSGKHKTKDIQLSWSPYLHLQLHHHRAYKPWYPRFYVQDDVITFVPDWWQWDWIFMLLYLWDQRIHTSLHPRVDMPEISSVYAMQRSMMETVWVAALRIGMENWHQSRTDNDGEEEANDDEDLVQKWQCHEQCAQGRRSSNKSAGTPEAIPSNKRKETKL
jgi:hypothetical protein